MKSRELSFYLGIIIPNSLSILFIALIAWVHFSLYSLNPASLWILMSLTALLGVSMSIYFWRSISLPWQDFIKYGFLNILVLLFWTLLLLV